jgi:hypothetical protein
MRKSGSARASRESVSTCQAWLSVVVNPAPGGEKVERRELQVRNALDLPAVASGRP